MKKIDDNVVWSMRIVGEDVWYPATVPGSVYNDLLSAGRLEDPYYRDNEDAALELMKNDFEYQGTFDAAKKELEDADEVLLRFNGLDTIADISLNGQKIASVNNMHRTWEYPVKNILKEEGNELKVYFHSPVRYIAEQHKADPGILGTEDAMRGFPKIRKAHYMFGWDWGPRLPDAGIWKSVELLKFKKARLGRIYIHQDFNDDLTEVELSVDYDIVGSTARISNTSGSDAEKRNVENSNADSINAENSKDDIKVRLTIISPDGETIHKSEYPNNAKISGIKIDSPRLWWPNGLGEQPLYTVTTELIDARSGSILDLDAEDSLILDSVTRRIGLRKMEMSTEKDEYGSEFAHKVNNVKFFAMGADYIPEDNILPRMNRERTYNLLKQCVAAHFNCIRVWGGGIYPSEDFYDACDELGLVVWQDMMFACANYRLTEDFEENIVAELRDQIRRLSHHASLGLWCGNNEMEMFAAKGEWGATEEIKSDYLKMYEDIFPRLLAEEAPDRFYWPASPSCGGGFDEPNSPDRGDAHYWEVWHGNKPFTEYRKFFFRYLSEFGFQSFPSIKTVESFTLPEDRNVFSYVMEKHQRNASANGKIMNYMEQTFLYPTDLDSLIYASQLLQAEAIRYGVEHFRRNRGRCMGTVYWQLNDCWPVASWSSIDYYGRWKALHYFAKRFFAPLMISCEEESLLTQTLNVNAEPFEVKKSIRLSVSNETMNPQETSVRWQLRRADGAVIREEESKVSVDALSSVWLDRIELPEAGLYDNYVSYQLVDIPDIATDTPSDGTISVEISDRNTSRECVISEGTVLLCPPKHFRFMDPKLKVRVEGDEIVVTAEHFAKSIEIRNKNDDLILSDNFFDLNSGEKRVKLLGGYADEISVRSVYDIGR